MLLAIELLVLPVLTLGQTTNRLAPSINSNLDGLPISCDLWGVDNPGPLDAFGMRVGMRLSELKGYASDRKRDQIRIYDDLKVQVISLKNSSNDELFVDTVPCDSGNLVIVGIGYADTRFPDWKSISVDAWKARETKSLTDETHAKVVVNQGHSMISLWSVKKATPVSGSAATEYIIAERSCLAGKSQSSDQLICALTSNRTLRIRSVAAALPANN